MWTEAADRTLCRIDKITQLDIVAGALLGGLVDRHGRERAAHVLGRLAEGQVRSHELRLKIRYRAEYA